MNKGHNVRRRAAIGLNGGDEQQRSAGRCRAMGVPVDGGVGDVARPASHALAYIRYHRPVEISDSSFIVNEIRCDTPIFGGLVDDTHDTWSRRGGDNTPMRTAVPMLAMTRSKSAL